MDQLWKERSLDLRMSPYECVSTGDNLGMLEVVRDSETIANIVGDAVDKNLSGVRRKRAAMKMVFKEDVVARWLKRECALRAEAEAKEKAESEEQRSGTPMAGIEEGRHWPEANGQ